MLSRLLSPIREFGPAAGWLYLTDRLLRWLSPRLGLYVYELLAQPISARPLLPAGLAKDIEIREIREGDAEVDAMPARTDIKQQRYRQGAVCLGAFREGEFIGYLWLCLGPYEEDEVRCTFLGVPETQSAFDFDLYLFPEHRMGLGFAAIWDGASRYLLRRGREVSFSRLNRFNLPSRRAHQRLGARAVARAWFLRVGAFEGMAATIRPYVHASFSQNDRVLLRLRSGIRGSCGRTAAASTETLLG